MVDKNLNQFKRTSMSNDERREMDRKLGQDLLKLQGNDLERFMNEQEFLRRNLKTGTNVIHLQYIGVLIPNDDILEFESELRSNSLELSYYDDSNSMKASVDELIAFIAINAQLTNWILSNVAWEVVWNFFLKVLTISFNKISEFRSKNPAYLKDRKVGVGITFEFNNEHGKESVNFTISADTNPKLAREARKMMETILKEHSKGTRYEQWHLEKDGKWKKDQRYDLPTE